MRSEFGLRTLLLALALGLPAVQAQTLDPDPAQQDSPVAPQPADSTATPAEPQPSEQTTPATETPPAAETPAEPGPSRAAETPPYLLPEATADPADPPCRNWIPVDEAMIDTTRRHLYQSLCGASLWLDSLFGDERNVSAARGAYGRLETSLAYSEFNGFKQRVRLDVRVDLPNLKDRALAFVGRDDRDEFVRDRSEGLALRSQFPSIDNEDDWLAGLGYSLPGTKRFSTNFRVGVRSLRHPRAFALSQIRYNAYADFDDVVQLRLTPFWNTRDGFGITPGVDYSHVLTPTRLLRWSNIGTISESSQGFDWRSSVILYQGLRKMRGIAFETFVRGATQDSVPLREYGGRVIYRQPLARRRLFGELVTGYSWPKEDPDATRGGSYLVGLNLELPFGRLQR